MSATRVAAGAVLAIVAIGALAYVVYSPMSQSLSNMQTGAKFLKSPSPEASTVSQATASSPYDIQVQRVVLDSVDSPAGDRFFLLSTNFSSSARGGWTVDPSGFQLVSNRGNSYHPSDFSAVGIGSTLGNLSLAQGQQGAGWLAFLLPDGELPALLNYADGPAAASSAGYSVPQVSGSVSYFTGVNVTASGASAPGLKVTASIANETGFAFITGERISVQVSATQDSAGQLSIASISELDASGATLVPATLPIPLKAGEPVQFDLSLLAPASGYKGELSLSLSLSPSAGA